MGFPLMVRAIRLSMEAIDERIRLSRRLARHLPQ